MNATAQPSASSASGPQLDNRRLIAGLIDLAIVAAGAAAVGVAAGVLGGDRAQIGLPVVAVMTAWALYYYFALESGGGQTLGKRLMRIRVVRVDGSAAGMGDIAVRTVLRVIDMQFMYLVGLVVMLVTGKRRARVGDLAANTMVVATDVVSRPLVAAPVAAAAPVPEARPAVAPETITLPSRAPAPSAAPAVPAPVVAPEPEPVAVVEPEPAAAAAAVAEPEPEPVAVADPEPAAVADPEPAAVVEPEPAAAPQDEPAPVVVKSVETVSAIDLVMGDDGPADDVRVDEVPPGA